MSSIGPEQTEVSRIRAAYARRNETVPSDRYSFFKDANLLLHVELLKEILKLLRRHQCSDLDRRKILDVGCGTGFWLRQMIQWGARPQNLFGIDLIEGRIQEATELCPRGITLRCGDASNLGFEDGTFDLLLQFTVFTSILDASMKQRVAREMTRVLKSGGGILWYDYFVGNPRNPDVRGVARREIARLFPGLSIFLKRVTLAPPIGRLTGPISPNLYRFLSSIKPLCTHYLGFYLKP